MLSPHCFHCPLHHRNHQQSQQYYYCYLSSTTTIVTFKVIHVIRIRLVTTFILEIMDVMLYKMSGYGTWWKGKRIGYFVVSWRQVVVDNGCVHGNICDNDGEKGGIMKDRSRKSEVGRNSEKRREIFKDIE